MTFPILGGNGAVAGYSIDNSLRFNDGDSPYLSRTPSVSGTTGTWTFSCWVKRGVSSTSSFYILSSGAVNQRGHIYFNSDNFIVQPFNSTGASAGRKTEAVFRDHSAWYHFLIVANGITTANLATNLDIYVNGVEFSTTATGSGSPTGGDRINDGQTKLIGQLAPVGGGGYYDGYLSEFHFIDGQALSPTDFGEFDEDNGIWKPIEYEGTYTGNSFYLDFENSGSLGADASGLGNDFTPTNLSATDQMIDTPTKNWSTLLPLRSGDGASIQTLSEGNLQFTSSSSGSPTSTGSSINIPTSGKWYFEVYVKTAGSPTSEDFQVGIQGVANDSMAKKDPATATYGDSTHYVTRRDSASRVEKNLSNVFIGNTYSYTAGDIISVAFDADSGKVWWGKNNTFWNSSGGTDGNPSSGTNNTTTLTTGVEYFFTVGQLSSTYVGVSNFGQDSSFAGNLTRQNNTDANGEGDFYYSVPTGFLALNSSNLATALSPTIDDGSAYFQTKTYTGNGVETAITNDGNSNLQPDLIWFKARSAAYYHGWFDSTRGTELRLSSNVTDAEVTKSSAFTSFDSDGFTVGADVSNTTNASGQTFVAWQWKANGGTTSSNTDGDITTTVQASTESGFSIVSWDEGAIGTPVVVGHGLGGTPEMIILKRRDGTSNWHTWHQGLGDGNNYLLLNGTNAKLNDSYEYISNIGSSTVQIQGGPHQYSVISYFFRSIEGYSKFGSYTGNGSTDGPMINLSFRPAFVMIKRTDSTGQWTLIDTTRQNYNLNDRRFHPNLSDAEYSGDGYGWDMLSNGFKLRTTSSEFNGSGASFIYMAFAESPFCTSSGVPVVAR